MKFGIGFGQDSTVHDVGQQARAAEEAGFSYCTFVDMGNVASDAYVMMTLIGSNTERIHVGQGVTDPILHNPAVIANAAATLREMTDNRAFVGLGVGGPYGKPFIRAARISELADAVRFIKAYTAGDEAILGEHSWHSEWIRRSQWRGQPVPVHLAVCGPRTCITAGEVSDACFSVGTDVVLQKWRKDMVERGATAAGRDPGEIDLWVRTQCYLADSKEAARSEVTPYAATCALELYIVLQRKTPEILDLTRRLERHHPGLLDELGAIHDAWDPYYAERRGGPQDEAVTQRVIDFFLATGTLDDVGDRLQQLQELGMAGTWCVMYSIQDEASMMEAIAKKVIPQFS